MSLTRQKIKTELESYSKKIPTYARMFSYLSDGYKTPQSITDLQALVNADELHVPLTDNEKIKVIQLTLQIAHAATLMNLGREMNSLFDYNALLEMTIGNEDDNKKDVPNNIRPLKLLQEQGLASPGNIKTISQFGGSSQNMFISLKSLAHEKGQLTQDQVDNAIRAALPK